MHWSLSVSNNTCVCQKRKIRMLTALTFTIFARVTWWRLFFNFREAYCLTFTNFDNHFTEITFISRRFSRSSIFIICRHPTPSDLDSPPALFQIAFTPSISECMLEFKYYQCFVVLVSLIIPHSHRECCCREHRVYFKCSLNAVPLWLYLIKVSRALHQSLSSGLSGFDWPCLLLFNVRWQTVEVSMPPPSLVLPPVLNMDAGTNGRQR